MTAAEGAQGAATPWVGRSILRREDRPLTTGQGRYVDNIALPRMAWVSIVRSPYANATITEVDLSAALEAPGVIAAFSGRDLMDDWAATLPCVWPVTEDIRMPPHWPLTPDKARHVGDGVAVVIAHTRAQARDAADLVDVVYEPHDAVTDVLDALAPDAPLVHDELDDNTCYRWRLTAGDPDGAFAQADVVIRETYRQQRLIISAMENRGVIADATVNGDVTLWSSTQIPHILRTTLAQTTGVPESKLRVIAPDVGGGFGGKVQVYAEEALCIGLARRLGRPVKWIEERSEGHTTLHHARDMVQTVELAADADGRISAMRVGLQANMGAYLGLNTPGIPLLGAAIYTGCYDIPSYDCECVGIFTHTTKTDAYRGAGRPEAAYAIERAIDALARRLGQDPAEIRRRNFHRSFPAQMAGGHVIDAGDFDACLDRALEMVGVEELRREQAARRAAGDRVQIGLGLCCYIEMAGLAPSRMLGAGRYGAGGWEAGTVRYLPTGTVQLVTGLSPHGQGTATTFAQVLADELGMSPDDIELIHGDTASSSLGMDTYGSRGLVIGGTAACYAARRLVDKARRIAGHQLEVAEEDLEFESGRFTVKGTDRGLTLKEVGMAAWQGHDLPEGVEPGLEATCVFDPPNYSWPSGAYAAVVEVDTQTGAVDLRRLIAVDDVGVVVNPMIVDGQVHGALAQGVAQALWEEAVYDEDGNLITGSLMNYLVPTAAELPSFELDRVVTPSVTNPLGAKGAGETGTIGAPPAVVNAVLDALAPDGVQHIDMPMTPERVWRALKEARA